MPDGRGIFKDMVKQRRVQAVTGIVAVAGIAMWLMAIPFAEYVAAVAIIFFAVATIHWVDDEEKLEEEQLQQAVIRK